MSVGGYIKSFSTVFDTYEIYIYVDMIWKSWRIEKKLLKAADKKFPPMKSCVFGIENFNK
jgi:hypothetical protein